VSPESIRMEGGTKAQETDSVARLPRPKQDSVRPDIEELASLVALFASFHDTASETLDFAFLWQRFAAVKH
jgi:hypothetical protein